MSDKSESAERSSAPPGRKVRRVFGRLRVESAGQRFTLELTREGLRVRELHSRRPKLISLASLCNFGRDQMEMFEMPRGKEDRKKGKR